MVSSHLGRPDGVDPAFAIAPCANRLRTLLPDERIRVLENTRFDEGETANDPRLAAELADGMDLYVNDAFGSAHRAHASTEGVAHLLPAYAGLLMLERARPPRSAAGRRRATVRARGGRRESGRQARSPAQPRRPGRHGDRRREDGRGAARQPTRSPFDVELPVDVSRQPPSRTRRRRRHRAYDDVPEGWLGLDIGPDSRERFAALIARARTIFWNGPMGVFEWPRFAEGTRAVAVAVAEQTRTPSSAAETPCVRSTSSGSRDERFLGLDRRRGGARARSRVRSCPGVAGDSAA